jgi:2-polyprenyl-3-methyl-5-hydroxy-6-metoxy-1,4-benzoquinol methylase
MTLAPRHAERYKPIAMVSPAEEPRTEACALCGCESSRPLVTGYDRIQARAADYAYVQCDTCAVVRLSPLPSPDEIAELYPDRYQPHVGAARYDDRKLINRMAIRYLYGVDSGSRSALMRALFRAISGRVMPAIREPLGGNRVLDVGCGSGSLLARYRALGWTVRGIEMDSRACDVCRERGIEVHHGTAFDAPFGNGEFDLIILHHVIEHVLDPVALLRRVGELLEPAGVVELRTPNIESAGFAWYGSCWYALDAPRHLMLFSPRTLQALSRRAGLDVRSLKTAGSTAILRRSHHYAKTQGRALPPDFAGRAEIVASAARVRRSDRVYRALVSPVARVAAAVGRGEILEAELTR